MAVPTDDTAALLTWMGAIKAMAVDGKGDGLVAAGGVAAIVGGMQAHVGVVEVQEQGINTLATFAWDRAEAVVAAGGVAAVVGGMRAHVGVMEVQEEGSSALGRIACGSNAGAEAVVAAGGVVAIVEGMQAHVRVAKVQEQGCWALSNIAFDSDARAEAVAAGSTALWSIAENSDAGAEAVVAVGGVTAVVAGMEAHVGVAEVQKQGRRALECMKGSCSGCGIAKELAAFCPSQLVKQLGKWECKECTGDRTGVSVDYQYVLMNKVL